jgi:hypothetical protein
MLIEPFQTGIPQQTATTLYIRVMPFDLDALTGSLYWEARTEDGQSLANGNYTLTEEEFAGRTGNVSYIEDILLGQLGLSRPL